MNQPEPAAAQIQVIVPTIGASPHLPACLDALLCQRSVDVEVLLVEQKKAAAKVPEAVRRLDAPGLGFAAAANAGLRAATTPLIALVNDDAIVAEHWLGALAEALSNGGPGLDSAQGTHTLGIGASPPAILDGIGLAFNRWWQAVQLGHGEPVSRTPAQDRSATAPCARVEVFGVSATAALYRREALQRVSATGSAAGAFDETLESYYEDVDLACRLRAAGSAAVWVPSARVEHAGSSSEGASRGTARSRLLVRNRLLVVARLLGRRLPLALPRILLRDLVDGFRAGAVGLADLPVGWSAALRRLPGSAHVGRPRVPISTLRRLGAENAWRELERSEA